MSTVSDFGDLGEETQERHLGHQYKSGHAPPRGPSGHVYFIGDLSFAFQIAKAQIKKT